MIRCASGSIQVVTKVARLRCRVPLERQFLADQAHRVEGRHPAFGEGAVGSVFGEEAVAVELCGLDTEVLVHRRSSRSREASVHAAGTARVTTER